MSIIDPELLRTFLAFVDGGSLARAAEIVHRSPSAVTTQMQRLEEIVGEPLLAVAGRGRSLTFAGEELVVHARRILAVHRDAWLSIKGARADGQVAIGATQDFADSILPELIRAFAVTHPRVRFQLRIGRSGELGADFQNGTIDVLLAMRGEPSTSEVGVLHEPMKWLASSAGLVVTTDEIPLALLDPPCRFRTSAVEALEARNRAYRITATSPSLAGLRAAVRGGIAIPVRTARWAVDGIGPASAALKLPEVPDAVFSIQLRADANPPARDFAELLREALGA
jgi:DNA-binding transcriptional LysR family regulator